MYKQNEALELESNRTDPYECTNNSNSRAVIDATQPLKTWTARELVAVVVTETVFTQSGTSRFKCQLDQ